ncbi:mlcH [Symbiodinium natans]|uniref:MlcH protein n=1 Tax=Symbiodinium natans TaxID=878477 RepID=A0A812NSM1_9DINO|nr:mlcH [Symbiodinium natans]
MQTGVPPSQPRALIAGVCLALCFLGLWRTSLPGFLTQPARRHAKKRTKVPVRCLEVREVDGLNLAKLDDLACRFNERYISAGLLKGALLAVVRRGEVVALWELGQYTSKTIFKLYSITKVFTAIAGLQSCEEHGISPEAPISSLVPEWPADLPGDMSGPSTEPLRLRHCLTHTGGFSNALPTVHPVSSLRPAELRRLRERRSNAVKPPRTLKEMVQRESVQPHIFVPGKHFNYCGAGSQLVARMVEEVSGMSIAEYMKKHIFEPIGMIDTGFAIDQSLAEHCVSADYHPWVLPAVADGLAGSRLDRWRLRLRSVLASLCGCALIDDLKPAGSGVTSPLKLWNRSSQLYQPDAGLVGTGADFVRFLEVLTRDASRDPVLSPFVLNALASPVTSELQAPFALDAPSVVGRLFPVRGDRLPRQKPLRPFNSFPGQRFSLGALLCLHELPEPGIGWVLPRHTFSSTPRRSWRLASSRSLCHTGHTLYSTS